MFAGIFVAAFVAVEPAFEVVLVAGVFNESQRVEVFAARLPMMLTLAASGGAAGLAACLRFSFHHAADGDECQTRIG